MKRFVGGGLGVGGGGVLSDCDGCGNRKLAGSAERSECSRRIIGCYIVGLWRGGASIEKWDFMVTIRSTMSS